MMFLPLHPLGLKSMGPAIELLCEKRGAVGWGAGQRGEPDTSPEACPGAQSPLMGPDGGTNLGLRVDERFIPSPFKESSSRSMLELTLCHSY